MLSSTHSLTLFYTVFTKIQTIPPGSPDNNCTIYILTTINTATNTNHSGHVTDNVFSLSLFEVTTLAFVRSLLLLMKFLPQA